MLSTTTYLPYYSHINPRRREIRSYMRHFVLVEGILVQRYENSFREDWA
jgi:uridine kinase